MDAHTTDPGVTEDDLVRAEQLRISFSQTGRAVFGGVGVSLLMTWILWPVAVHQSLLLWLLCQVVLSGIRGSIYLAYRRRQPTGDITKWQRLLLSGAFIQGSLWGAVWWLFLPISGHPEYTMIVGAFTIGLSAASVSAYSVSTPAMFAFFIPVLTPGIPRSLMIGGQLEVGLALGLGIYAYIVITAMLPINRGMIDAIRLNFANAREIARRQSVESLLRELSITDGLTGLATRRHFDEVLYNEIERARRTHTSIALILADIDCFKLLNDSRGHVEGDHCLQQVASIVHATGKRPTDLAARYGGEEFAVILPNTSATEAYRLAEALRQEVESLQLQNEATRVIDKRVITMSIGVVSMVPSLETDARDLIDAADKALYRAKEAGRNRVEVG